MVKQTKSNRHKLPAGPGRPKGIGNKTTTALKDAILQAAESAGADGNGKEGMIGYLKKQANENPTSFNGLLGKVLPLQIANDGDETFKVTMIERVVVKAKE